MAEGNKQDLFDRTRRALVSTIMLVSVISVQLWLSVFLYFTFYYIYMPVEKFEQPVFLEYSPCRQFTGVESCPFPGSNISLREDYSQGRVLMRGQKYDVVLDLELPQSPVNERQGVFMVEVSLYSDQGRITASAAKPVMLKYRSSLLRLMDTLLYIPLFLFGYKDESQTFSVTLMEDFVDNPTKPVHGAYIEVRARQIEIYSMNFLIRAQFSGLRYFLFYWPLTSAFFAVTFNFSILSIISFLSWGQISWLIFGESTKVPSKPSRFRPENQDDLSDDAQIVPVQRGARKKERRKDVLADVKTSMGSHRPASLGTRRDMSYCNDSDDDDVLLCAPESPGRSRSTATQDGSSDSFEAIDEGLEEGAEGGLLDSARYRGGRTSTLD